jgi:hypothetical protein
LNHEDEKKSSGFFAVLSAVVSGRPLTYPYRKDTGIGFDYEMKKPGNGANIAPLPRI